MEVILTGTVNEDRRLIVELPDTIPSGPVEIVIRTSEAEEVVQESLTLERARAILKAAGKLASPPELPENFVSLPEEEFERLTKLFAGDRPSHELIDEDRGEY